VEVAQADRELRLLLEVLQTLEEVVVVAEVKLAWEMVLVPMVVLELF
jgi:hypothetical protein